MDPIALDKDELSIELVVRGLGVGDVRAIDLLKGMLVEETSGLRDPPSKLHQFRSLTTELAECQKKLAALTFDLTSLSSKPDEALLMRCGSRICHLRSRVQRLKPSSGHHAQLIRLEQEIDEFVARYTDMIRTGEEPAELGAASLESQRHSLMNVLKILPHNPASSARSPLENAGDISLRSDQPTMVLPAVGNGASPQTTASPPFLQDMMGNGWFASNTISAAQRAFSDRSPPSSLFPQSNAVQADVPFRREVGGSPLNLRGAASVPLGVPPVAVGGAAIPAVADRVPAMAAVAPPLGANGGANGWTMLKWPLRFGGGSRDMPVDEFLFRAETLARVGNLSQGALTWGLHQILTGAAASWYWVYIRNEPNATWPQVRAALTFAFQSNISDTAIRRQINDRLQQQGERFMDFCLAIQELAVRLATRMSDAELLETLRRNMLPALQDQLLFLPTATVFELQRRCKQIEELWQRQSEVQQARRASLKVHEIVGASVPYRQQVPDSWPEFSNSPMASAPVQSEASVRSIAQLAETVSPGPAEVARQIANPFHTATYPEQAGEHESGVEDQRYWLCAVESVANKRSEYTVCWNCDDLGHTFLDCTVVRRIFCYGCGTKNVFRPQCPKCSIAKLQGNGRRNGRQTGAPNAEQSPSGQPFRMMDRMPRSQ